MNETLIDTGNINHDSAVEFVTERLFTHAQSASIMKFIIKRVAGMKLL